MSDPANCLVPQWFSVYVVVGGKEIRLFDVNIELFLENPILFLSITKITYIQVLYIPAYRLHTYTGYGTHSDILIFYEVLYYNIFVCDMTL